MAFEDGWANEFQVKIQKAGNVAFIYNLGVYFRTELTIGQTYKVATCSTNYSGNILSSHGNLNFNKGIVSYTPIFDTSRYVCYGYIGALKI